jgi:hypothetical protein
LAERNSGEAEQNQRLNIVTLERGNPAIESKVGKPKQHLKGYSNMREVPGKIRDSTKTHDNTASEIEFGRIIATDIQIKLDIYLMGCIGRFLKHPFLDIPWRLGPDK